MRLALEQHFPPELVEGVVSEMRQGIRGDFVRQDVDVNGDGQTEIIITDSLYERRSAYVAVIGRGVNGWRELYFQEDLGWYCYNMRATIQQTRVIADFMGCGGGTGVLNYAWTQHWIECNVENCRKVWSEKLFDAVSSGNTFTYNVYSIAYLEQPDSKTIFLTTNQFGVGATCADCPTTINRPRRTIGPNTRDTFQWNGETWDLVKHEQISQGIEIAREYDESANQSSGFIGNTLHEQFGLVSAEVNASGGSYSYDLSKTWAAKYAFFELQVPQSVDDDVWKTEYDQPVIEVAASDSRGVNYAAILARTDKPLCRLVVRRFENNRFMPIGLADVSCIDTFTHLSWVDVDGDGKEELLLLTIVNAAQQLSVYKVDSSLIELTHILGEINGDDGVGIKWIQTKDGFRLYAGLPLAEMYPPVCPILTFSCINTDRRFQTYRWDKASNKFVIVVP